jgi:hypothetical protein
MRNIRVWMIWAVSVLAAAGLYFAHGQTQPSNGAYAAQFQQAAQSLLNSPNWQLLSGAGLSAVKLLAATISPSGPAVPRLSQELLPVPT